MRTAIKIVVKTEIFLILNSQILINSSKNSILAIFKHLIDAPLTQASLASSVQNDDLEKAALCSV